MVPGRTPIVDLSPADTNTLPTALKRAPNAGVGCREHPRDRQQRRGLARSLLGGEPQNQLNFNDPLTHDQNAYNAITFIISYSSPKTTLSFLGP